MIKHFLKIIRACVSIFMPVRRGGAGGTFTKAICYFVSYGRRWQLQVLVCCVFFMFTGLLKVRSQTPETTTAEQQLENNAAANNDTETEDDTYLQQLLLYIKHPVNLNTADEDDLKELHVISALQIQNFLRYRNLFGKLIDICELQAVPGWDMEIIQKLRPFITVSNGEKIFVAFKNRLHNGEQSLLLRVAQTLERSKGYLTDTVFNHYPGSPQQILLRYKYQYKNLLQYGMVAEKDAGEQFFSGSQKKGFDFYSAHLFIRNAGVIQLLAIGDFTVNLGQGLIQWQNMAFKKSADVMNIKREAAILRPYNSSGENNFHRGAGVTIKKKNFQNTIFASLKNTDANLVKDTMFSTGAYVSSFQTSGYHRTRGENEDKGRQQQLVLGGNLSYNNNGLHVGVNTVLYKFRQPLQKDAAPYNLYALTGKHLGNYSVDYAFTLRNLHFFGEAAADNKKHTAVINGMLMSVAASADMSLLYRNISAGYQSMYSNAFTENTFPGNERGLYTGISVHPGTVWRLDAYADIYQFPWLKYQVNAPSRGSDFMIQVTYKPGKQVEFYSRYSTGTKDENGVAENVVLPGLISRVTKKWRCQVGYKINPSLNIRNRIEMVWANGSNETEQGFLAYSELFYKPPLKRWSVVARAQLFETDGYSSRLYAYETDVLYSYSVPAFYDKGRRYYVVGTYDITKKLTLWVRLAQTGYRDKHNIGSGPDEIKGGHKTSFKLQLQYFF